MRARPEVTRASIDTLSGFVRRREPALLSGAISPADCRAWSPDTLRRAAGNLQVRVEKSDEGVQVPAVGQNRGRFERIRQPLGAVLDTMEAPGPPYFYASSLRIRQVLPGRAHALPHLPVPLPGEPELILFVGQRATGSHWHYDASYNFLLVLHGAKTALLRPPSVFRAMAPSPFWSCLPHFSSMPPVNNEASPAECAALLQAGDCLFIPPGWWHHVVNESPCIGMTCTYPLPAWDLLRWRFLRLRLSHRFIHRRAGQ